MRVEVLSTHARVFFGQGRHVVIADAFRADDVDGWDKVAHLMETMSEIPSRRVCCQISGPWPWASEPLPTNMHTMCMLENERLAMQITRDRAIESALRVAKLKWNTVDTLRKVDMWCKEALRVHSHPRDGVDYNRMGVSDGVDFVAEQLGFTANRHKHVLDLNKLVKTVETCEQRFNESRLLFEQMDKWPTSTSCVSDAIARLCSCPSHQEIGLSLCWASRCHVDNPWDAPPRPENTTVDDPVQERRNLRALTEQELAEYWLAVCSKKSIASVCQYDHFRPMLAFHPSY